MLDSLLHYSQICFPSFGHSPLFQIRNAMTLPLSDILDFVKCRFWRPGQASTRSQLRHWILHLCIHQSWWHIICVTALWWNASLLREIYLELRLESRVEFISSLGMIVSSKKHVCWICLISSMKVTPEDVLKLNLPPECISKTPSGETFVKSNLQKVKPFYWCSFWMISITYMGDMLLFFSGNTSRNSRRTVNCS